MVALAVSQSLATLEWLGGHFSPATLFATSEPGVWYDPSDVANTLWLYNLLTFTEQFDNAAWSKTGATITANAAIAPNGTTTADRLTEDTSTGPHRVFQTVNIPATPHAFSFYAKPAGRDWVYVYANAGFQTAFINVSTGAIGSVLGSSNISVTAVGDGWYRVSLGFSNVTVGSQNIQIWTASADGTINYTGNGTSGIFIWGAQLQTGSTATTYQPITTVDAGTIARFPLATLYQDIAGTTPVTAPNQPVGMMLSKDKGLVLGPELVTNGDFSGGSTGWAVPAGWTITGGGAVGAATNASLVGGGVTSVAGRTYRVEFDVVSYTSGSLYITVGGNFSGNPSLAGAAMAPGRKSVFVISGSSLSRGVEFYGGSIAATIDNISVKELPGNHATQSTSGSRPTYGIVPATGRRNLLTYSEQFDNAVWSKDAVGISANSTTAPNGTLTADTCTPNTATSAHLLFQTTTVSGSNVQSVYVKANGYTKVALREGQTGAYFASFDLSGSGSVLFTSSATATITAVGNGWFRIAVVGTLTGTTRLALYVLDPSYTTGSVTSSWTPNGTSGIFIWGAQVENGSAVTAYQRVVTAFEVTEANVASLSYISFDGIDDFMVTPTITPGTNKAQVFAGVRKLSDASSYGVVAELGADAPQGAFTLLAPHIGATFSWLSKGTGGAYAVTSTAFPAPTTNILTGIGDIAADTANLRVNGTQAATSTTDQGTGNYLAYPLYIGRRGGTTLPFNGQMYGLITRFGANLNTSQLVSTEGWVNTKTGAY